MWRVCFKEEKMAEPKKWKNRKRKYEIFEETLNNITGYPSCWVYNEGSRYIIQSKESGHYIATFKNSAEFEKYIDNLKK